jgi:hypothetical protein
VHAELVRKEFFPLLLIEKSVTLNKPFGLAVAPSPLDLDGGHCFLEDGVGFKSQGL